MSYSQINFLVLVKGEKLNDKKAAPTSPLLPPSLLRKSGVQTGNAVYAKKALGKFLVLCKPKRIVVPGLVSIRTAHQMHTHASFQESLVAKVFKTITHLHCCSLLPRRTFFSFRGRSQSWPTSRCPRTASIRARSGSYVPSPKTSLPTLLAVDGMLQKVRQHWQ